MKAKDAKLVCELFLNKTPVITSPDFNILYDIFLGQESKPLTAKEFGIIIDLFLGYSKKPKMQAKDSKLLCDLFLDKTQVLTTPDFNILYDIFLGKESKPLTVKEFGTIIDLFMGYSKKPKLQAKDSKLLCELFLDKTPVVSTPYFNFIYDIFLGQESKPLTAKEFGTIIDLFMGYSKKPKMQA